MPNGFLGASANNFIRETHRAMLTAVNAHNRKPFEGFSAGNVPLPRIEPGVNQRFPFSADDGLSGRHAVGIGNSSNVVVEQVTYEDSLRKVDMVDDQAGEEIYRAAMAIEEMCSSMYIVPETAPKIMAITNQIKNSLGRFRSLTEDVNIETRRFVNEIRHIDQGGDMFFLAMQDMMANDVVNRASGSMNQQAENMRNTSQELCAAAREAREEAMERFAEARDMRDLAREIRQQICGLQEEIKDLRRQTGQNTFLWPG